LRKPGFRWGQTLSVEAFARVDWFAAPPGGTRSRFTVVIWAPKPHAGGDFACSVQIGSSTVHPIVGVDSLQSLVLALVYVRHELEQHVLAGWAFYRSSTDLEAFDPSSYFVSRA